MDETRICPQCQAPLPATATANQKYCSRACYAERNYQHHLKRVAANRERYHAQISQWQRDQYAKMTPEQRYAHNKRKRLARVLNRKARESAE